MSEAVCVPNYSRNCKQYIYIYILKVFFSWKKIYKYNTNHVYFYLSTVMSELLFECYNVPSVTYGIDALFSFYNNGGENEDGIIISSGHSTTHIIPTIQGKGILQKAKR